jgi:DNA-nicking Smr family endonuclease
VASNDRLQERIDRDKGRGANVVNGGRVAKQEDPYVMEIDLHLHELVDDERHLDHDEKLRYQINYFERMLNTAIREHKRKLIVIHGIGEGVLREEVRKTLQYYDGVRFDDADPRRYGYGATEVTILRH